MGNKPDTKENIFIWLVCMTCPIYKYIETENRVVASRTWSGAGWIYFWIMNVLELDSVNRCKTVDIPNVCTDALKWWSLGLEKKLQWFGKLAVQEYELKKSHWSLTALSVITLLFLFEPVSSTIYDFWLCKQFLTITEPGMCKQQEMKYSPL